MLSAKLHVLLVEDNPGDARLLLDHLAETRGSAALTVEHVERLGLGLERLSRGGIDAVLLDLGLPDSQGLDGFSRLHKAFPAVACLVLTGLDDEEVAVEAVRLGAQDYLVKGQADGPLVGRAVRYAVERRRLRAELALQTQELERKRWEGQLARAEKMEAVGQLAAGIAHEFNNLMTVVTGYAELMRARPEDTRLVASGLEEISSAGYRAAELTKKLLAYGARQMLQLRRLDLGDLVAEHASLLRKLAGPDIEVTVRHHLDAATVKADPTQIQQILLNLVLNARDAMPEGGRIEISAAAIDTTEPVIEREGAIPPGSYAVLAVADTGTGMDAAVVAKLFEPFFTTRPFGVGRRGLGLAEVYGIVRQSRGYICVDSAPGRGSRFEVWLPRLG